MPGGTREYQLTCEGCGVGFTAKSPLKKWHTPGCKKAKQRAADQPAEGSGTSTSSSTDAAAAAGAGKDHKPTAETEYGRDILDAVRKDLQAADRVETVNGRIALYLARKSIDPKCSNPAAMLKEMRAALALALEGAEKPGLPEPDPATTPAAPIDEVAAARERAKELAAQGGAGA